MGRPDLNRRQLLAAAGGLSVAASFGFAALGTGADALASGADTRVRYWNLFSGGDGANMIAMLDAFRKANPDIDVKDSTLQWGNPFYTKLAMAAAGNRAPRPRRHAPGPGHRLLAGPPPGPVGRRPARQVRRTGADFNPALWKRGVIDGKLYALPLDIHVQLCFYRKDVLEKAGPARRRRPDDPGHVHRRVVRHAQGGQGRQKKGLQTLGLQANDQNFQWWFFVAFYTQLGGTWFDDADTEVTFDTDKATQVLEFLRRHVTDGYVIPAGHGEQFINGAPFTWEGNWSGAGLLRREAGVRRDPAAARLRHAGHPRRVARLRPAAPGRPRRRHQRGRAPNSPPYVVTHALQWAAGGHIPAYTPTLSTAAYKKLDPAERVRRAMDHQATEPKVWFAGSTGVLAQRRRPDRRLLDDGLRQAGRGRAAG